VTLQDSKNKTHNSQLIIEYGDALKAELAAIEALEPAQRGLERIKAVTLQDAERAGKLDGRNAAVRDRQAQEVLIASQAVQAAERVLADAEHAKALAHIEVKVIEAQISLTRAWLYSQSGVR